MLGGEHGERFAPAPRPVSRFEATAWRVLAWTPSAAAAYVALGTVGGCRPIGDATPRVVLLGILWGVLVYGAAFALRAWAHRAWPHAQQALRAGDDVAAEAAMRRICTMTRVAPDYHAACLGGLAQVAMRRGELDTARAILESTLATPWLVGPGRAGLLYTLSSVHALAGRPAEGRRSLAAGDAVAPQRLAVWSAVAGAHLAIAEGAFAEARAKLDAVSKRAEDLQSVASSKLAQALRAYCAQKTGSTPDEVGALLASASPLSRRQVGHYLRAWADFEAFVVERGVVVEG
jgi:hypothetical protein